MATGQAAAIARTAILDADMARPQGSLLTGFGSTIEPVKRTVLFPIFLMLSTPAWYIVGCCLRFPNTLSGDCTDGLLSFCELRGHLSGGSTVPETTSSPSNRAGNEPKLSLGDRKSSTIPDRLFKKPPNPDVSSLEEAPWLDEEGTGDAGGGDEARSKIEAFIEVNSSRVNAPASCRLHALAMSASDASIALAFEATASLFDPAGGRIRK